MTTATWDDEQVQMLAAKLYRRTGELDSSIGLDDLIQEGRMLAIRAGEDFDPTRGMSLKSWQGHKIWRGLVDFMRSKIGREFRMNNLLFNDEYSGSQTDDTSGMLAMERISVLLSVATDKEREVIILRAQGLKLREIADQLGISPDGVAGRMRKAFARLPSHVPLTRDLTVREHEILQMVAEGETNDTVAKHLNLSEETIKSHMRHIYDALGILPGKDHRRGNPRVAAVTAGLRKGIIA